MEIALLGMIVVWLIAIWDQLRLLRKEKQKIVVVERKQSLIKKSVPVSLPETLPQVSNGEPALQRKTTAEWSQWARESYIKLKREEMKNASKISGAA